MRLPRRIREEVNCFGAGQAPVSWFYCEYWFIWWHPFINCYLRDVAIKESFRTLKEAQEFFIEHDRRRLKEYNIKAYRKNIIHSL